MISLPLDSLRFFLLCLGTTFLLVSCHKQKNLEALDFHRAITPEALAAHVHFIASDLTEGRQTGSRGEHISATYLASQYMRMGLLPAGNTKNIAEVAPEDYMQKVPLLRREKGESRLEVLIKGTRRASSLFSEAEQDDLAYFNRGNAKEASGSVVFGGFGIAADSLGYNDFAALSEKGISIDGKWLMIFADEPLLNDTVSLLPTYDKKPSAFSSGLGLGHKRAAIWKYGQPAGVLVITDSSPRFKGSFRKSAQEAAVTAAHDQALKQLFDEQKSFPPIYNISTRLANIILKAENQSVDKLLTTFKAARPVVFALPEVIVETKGERYGAVQAYNVAAYLEGSDPRLKDEILIIGAHYDHLGRNVRLEGDQIFNGAADDASGTAAVLVLAEAFVNAKKNGNGPKRSILFVNFTGEEHGRLGSLYYVQRAPLMPLKNTVAVINMDGIGGREVNAGSGSSSYIYVTGNYPDAKDLLAINSVKNTAASINLDIISGEGRPFFSDHQSFESIHIPYLYYSTGLTEHYHKVSDEAYTLDYDQMTKITHLIFATALEAASEGIVFPERSGVSQASSYVCPPCPFKCHDLSFTEPGICPVCDMNLELETGI